MIAVFSLATIIALALQTTVTRLLPFAILMPNLALVLVVNLGLRYYSAAAAVMAFGIGYATDSFSGGRLGLNAALFIVVFIATYGLSRAVLSRSSGATMREMIPWCSASSASIGRPVRTMSLTTPCPHIW